MDIVFVVGAVDNVEKGGDGVDSRSYRNGSPAAPTGGAFAGRSYSFEVVDKLGKMRREKEKFSKEKTFCQSMG